MNDSSFYQAIDAAWKESGGRWDLHEKALHRILTEWSEPQLVEYCVTIWRLRGAAFTPQIYNAAFMLWDGALGMDGFLDFSDALAVTPKPIYESAIRDPDSMINVPELWNPSSSFFWLIPHTVYDRRKGVKEGTHLLDEHMPDDGVDSATLWKALEGHPNRQAARDLLPQIYARFGEQAFAGR